MLRSSQYLVLIVLIGGARLVAAQTTGDDANTHNFVNAAAAFAIGAF
jgi:hypothetical protein